MTVALRELASLRDEKTIVLALLIQVFVAAFSSFLVVGLVSMYDPGAGGDFELTVGIAGEETETLRSVAAEEPAVNTRLYPDEAAATSAFADREVDAVIVTRIDDGNRVRAAVTVPEGSFRTTMTVVKLRDLLERYERHLRQQRSDELDRSLVAVPAGTSGSPYFGFTYTVLVPLLVFLPAFIGGSIAVDSLSEEIERGTLELLRVTPATLPEIVDGKLAAAAAPVPLQVFAWIVLLEANGTNVAHVPALLIFTAAVGFAVAGLGVGVAVATRNRRQAQFLYSSGLLVLFGASLLLPETPQNVVARLAVGSPGPATYWSLLGTIVIAAATVITVRYAITRTNTDDL